MGTGEKQFKRWITSTAPTDWLVQTIETSTGSGVPDLFMCHNGHNLWTELKSTEDNKCYMRITQWYWFNRLLDKGGKGFLFIKRVKDKRVDVYDMSDIRGKISRCSLLIKSPDVVFPPTTQPVFSYKLGASDETFYQKLERILDEG